MVVIGLEWLEIFQGGGTLRAETTVVKVLGVGTEWLFSLRIVAIAKLAEIVERVYVVFKALDVCGCDLCDVLEVSYLRLDVETKIILIDVVLEPCQVLQLRLLDVEGQLRLEQSIKHKPNGGVYFVL